MIKPQKKEGIEGIVHEKCLFKKTGGNINYAHI
jgi:hypothetical protein